MMFCILVRKEMLTATSFVFAAEGALAVNVQPIVDDIYLELVVGTFDFNIM